MSEAHRGSAASLIWPHAAYLPGYLAALERGWTPSNMNGAVVAREEQERIRADAAGFVASLVDRNPAGRTVALPDGSRVARLPGYRKWIWDGEFCGSIGLRWQHGTSALPDYCLGHIGYGVVPWKRRRGYATQALRQILQDARAEGLALVEITTQPDNLASQRVITANGGVLVERFVTIAALGGLEELRYRIDLA
jgi:predicted acetyltransferase